LKPFVEDPVVREYLNKIIDEEKHHIELLKEITDRKEVFTTIID
jgi:hypothetical protein